MSGRIGERSTSSRGIDRRRSVGRTRTSRNKLATSAYREEPPCSPARERADYAAIASETSSPRIAGEISGMEEVLFLL